MNLNDTTMHEFVVDEGTVTADAMKKRIPALVQDLYRIVKTLDAAVEREKRFKNLTVQEVELSRSCLHLALG